MADNDLTLSRRQVLGGAATIGIAGALGAGTWAELSDEETATVNAQAGSIDLNVDGKDATYTFNFGDDLKNGDSPSQTVSLTNTGSLDGKSLCFTIENYEDGENGAASDSETKAEGGNVGSNGELDDVSTLTIKIGGTTLSTNPSGNGDLGCVSSPLPLGSGGKDLTVTLDIPNNNINKAMGDSLSFDLVMTLYDEPQT